MGRACQDKSEENGRLWLGNRGNPGKSGDIEGTGAAGTRTFDDMEVDHGGGDVGMSEKILNGADVGAALKQARSERVAERMTGGPLGDIGLGDGVLELALHGCLMEVMAGDASGLWVWTEGGGGEDVLPRPFAGSTGPFAQQGFRHVDLTGTNGQILEVFAPGLSEMVLEAFFKRHRQRDDPVLAALAVVNGDGALVEIKILGAEAEAFHQSQTRTKHELSSEFPRVFQMGKDGGNFPAREHDRWSAVGVAVVRRLDGEILDAENAPSEEDHGIERLFLCRSRDVALQRQRVEVGSDGWRASVLRGLFELRQTKAGKADVPIYISLLGGVGETFKADGAAEGFNDAGDFGVDLWQGDGRVLDRLRGKSGARRTWQGLRRDATATWEHGARRVRQGVAIAGQDAAGIWRQGSNLDAFATMRAMVGLQGPRLVGKAPPIKGRGPRESEDLKGQNAHGIHGLTELPVVEVGGSAKGVEEGGGGGGGTMATGLGPCLGPLDEIPAGGGLDGERDEALEET